MTSKEEDYQEASRRIREAKRTAATELDLSRLHSLEVLPSGISSLLALTNLGLRSTRISILVPLAPLSALTVLDLSYTRISDASPLSSLSNLTNLDLSGTQFSDSTPLARLANLNSLNLRGTIVHRTDFLDSLPALQKLDLRGTRISDIRSLKKLSRLTILDVSGTNIADIRPLSSLYGITMLDLSYTKISDASPLASLTSLTKLDLRGTRISDASALASLYGLTTLELSLTRIPDARPLAALSSLTDLNLSRTDISDAAPLASLSALTKLDLSHTRIPDASPLAALSSLTNLNLSYTEVSDASPIASLSALTKLDLSHTRIPDASPLAALSSLTNLNLSYTDISDASPIASLSALTKLDLSHTRIPDASPLAALSSLTVLNLQTCQRLVGFGLPESSVARLKKLCLNECPLFDLPREFCKRGNNKNVAPEVLSYLRAKREQGSSYLDECKLIVLGNGRAGKTSTLKALRGEPFDSREDSTHAIRLLRWPQSIALQGRTATVEVRLNVWDFGGQDIYHQSHRLFLRTRAVFLICWNAWEDRAARREEGDEPRGLGYWIEQIRSVNPDAPILLVRTHADWDDVELQRRGLAAVPTWRELAPEVEGDLPCLALSARVRTEQDVQAITQWIHQAVADELSRGSNEYSAAWLQVRARLAELEQANTSALERTERPPHGVLSRAEFANLVRKCLPAETWERDLPFIRQFLHDIGALFYDARLSGRIVLDQRWAIDGFYALLRPGLARRFMERHAGRFTRNDVARIWSDAGYTPEDQSVLLEFMEACGQAVRYAPRWETGEESDTYMAPALLPSAARHPGAVPPVPDERAQIDIETACSQLGADGCAAVIVAIACVFSSHGIYWRWGSEIESASSGAIARVDWEPFHADSYGGTLRLRVWGRQQDAAALARAMQDLLVRVLPQGAEPDRRLHGIHERYWRTTRSRPPQPQTVPRTSGVQPPQAQQAAHPGSTPLGIAVSFAGGTPPGTGIEVTPLALTQELDRLAMGAHRVVMYRKEDDRVVSGGKPTAGTMPRLYEHIADARCLVVFLSQKYLFSAYCMRELQLSWEQEPAGIFDDQRVTVFNIDEAQPARDEWMKRWRKDADAYTRQLLDRRELEDAEDHAPRRLLALMHAPKNDVCALWFALVGDAQRFNDFADALFAVRTIPAASEPPEAVESFAKQWAPQLDAAARERI